MIEVNYIPNRSTVSFPNYVKSVGYEDGKYYLILGNGVREHYLETQLETCWGKELKIISRKRKLQKLLET